MIRSRLAALVLVTTLVSAAGCSSGDESATTTSIAGGTTTTSLAPGETTTTAGGETTTTGGPTTTTTAAGGTSTTTTGGGTTTTSPVPTTRVDSADADYAVSYPEEWTVNQQDNRTFLVGPFPPAGLPAWKLDINPVDVPPGTDLASVVAAARATDAASTEDFALLGEGATTVGDLAARYYEFRGFDVTELITRQTMTINGSTLYVFRFTAPAETYEEGLPAALEVIGSFELKG